MLIGDRLKQLRLEKELTRERLGVLIDKSVSSIANFENNNSYPRIETLNDICKVFNVPLSTFFEDYRPQPKEVNLSEMKNIELVELINKASGELSARANDRSKWDKCR